EGARRFPSDGNHAAIPGRLRNPDGKDLGRAARVPFAARAVVAAAGTREADAPDGGETAKLMSGRVDGAALSKRGAVRVGHTVRRPPAESTATVQAYLGCLRRAGLTSVAEPLGYDEEGWEVQGWVEGEAG